jgi:hypothetical protein
MEGEQGAVEAGVLMGLGDGLDVMAVDHRPLADDGLG